MDMEQRWDDIKRGKPKNSEKNKFYPNNKLMNLLHRHISSVDLIQIEVLCTRAVISNKMNKIV